jgi:hypothetical protein
MAQAKHRTPDSARRRLAVVQGQGRPPGLALASKGEPATWEAARAVSETVGDYKVHERVPVPCMDYMCGPNAQGVQGRMVAQAGLMFCVWE